MSTLIDDLKKSRTLQGEELDNFLYQIRDKYTSEEDKKVITDFMMNEADLILAEMDRISNEITIRQQLKEVSEILSLSYIAKKYFNKTRTWLYQRINGNIVHGKAAKFTDEELETLRFALKDISNRIGSLTIN